MSKEQKRRVVGAAATVAALAGVGLAVIASCGNSEGSPFTGGDAGRHDSGIVEPPGTPPTDPQSDVTFFLSGHSLTDDPLAEDVVAIATSLGLAGAYNEQIVIGSPIRVRTRGSSGTGWAGYSTGKNRAGSSGLAVISELANPATVTGPYDALVITERHDLVSTLHWEDTVRLLRHYHDRLVAGNSHGSTYVYHSWLDVSNRSDPAEFIAYERTMYPVWECIAERIQVSLDAEGSQSSIFPLPAGIALTDLVEAAVAGEIPGLAGGSTEDVVERIFADDVHIGRVGVHYMALVTFATVYRRSPVGAAAPAGISADLAGDLQALAWASVSRHHHPEPRGLAGCRAYMRDVACDAYGAYRDSGAVTGCKALFSESATDNPFRYDAATDAGYWYAAP